MGTFVKQLIFGILLIAAIPAMASRSPALTARSFAVRQQTFEAYEAEKIKHLTKAMAICESLMDGPGCKYSGKEIDELHRVMFANHAQYFAQKRELDRNAMVCDLLQLQNVWALIFNMHAQQGIPRVEEKDDE